MREIRELGITELKAKYNFKNKEPRIKCCFNCIHCKVEIPFILYCPKLKPKRESYELGVQVKPLTVCDMHKRT